MSWRFERSAGLTRLLDVVIKTFGVDNIDIRWDNNNSNFIIDWLCIMYELCILYNIKHLFLHLFFTCYSLLITYHLSPLSIYHLFSINFSFIYYYSSFIIGYNFFLIFCQLDIRGRHKIIQFYFLLSYVSSVSTLNQFCTCLIQLHIHTHLIIVTESFYDFIVPKHLLYL